MRIQVDPGTRLAVDEVVHTELGDGRDRIAVNARVANLEPDDVGDIAGMAFLVPDEATSERIEQYLVPASQSDPFARSPAILELWLPFARSVGVCANHNSKIAGGGVAVDGPAGRGHGGGDAGTAAGRYQGGGKRGRRPAATASRPPADRSCAARTRPLPLPAPRRARPGRPAPCRYARGRRRIPPRRVRSRPGARRRGAPRGRGRDRAAARSPATAPTRRTSPPRAASGPAGTRRTSAGARTAGRRGGRGRGSAARTAGAARPGRPPPTGRRSPAHRPTIRRSAILELWLAQIPTDRTKGQPQVQDRGR